MLLLLFVSLYRRDCSRFSFALGLPHFVVTEAQLVFLIPLLRLDGLLERSNDLLDVWINVAESVLVLLEVGDDVVVLEGLATLLEQVLSVVDVRLFQLL